VTLVEPALAERVLERALARGGDYAELYAEARHGFGISLDDGRVERPQDGRERGACVRVVSGDSTYYGHVDGLAEPDLLRVAESASQALRAEARAPSHLSAAQPAAGHEIELRPEQVAVERKADVLRAWWPRRRRAGR
jgi:TldD protein